MDTSFHLQALKTEIEGAEKILSQKSKVYQKMMDDLSKIEDIPGMEKVSSALNKNIDKVLKEILGLNSKLTILKSSKETLDSLHVVEVMVAMSEWRAETINPFSNPALAGILQNPFLVSPKTN